MESVYHIVAIRVNETSWAHVWRLRSHFLGTGYDTIELETDTLVLDLETETDVAQEISKQERYSSS
jgi:hypothetical protein